MRSILPSSDLVFVNLEIYQVEPDWQRLAKDMREAGMSYSKQAFALEREPSTYQRWRNRETPPPFACGLSILMLHSKICGSELTLERLRERVCE